MKIYNKIALYNLVLVLSQKTLDKYIFKNYSGEFVV